MKLFLSSYLLTTALTKSFLVSAVCFSNNMNKLLFLTMFSTLSAAEKTSFVSSKVRVRARAKVRGRPSKAQ
jgi:hypothetical protein